MPEFRHPDEAEVETRGEGWQVTVLADERHIPSLRMAARHWTVEPSVRTSEWSNPGPDERVLYVISGRGAALVGAERLDIGPEDLIWLDPGDTFALEAADEPLRVLDAASAMGAGVTRLVADR
jgi:quercetin dioxygenase-like cupin family protein